MKGFQWLSSRWLMVLLIGLAVVLGIYAEHHLRERIQPAPVQVPAAEQSSRVAPIRADGPLHEVSQRMWTESRAQSRWVF
ncbi:hypothetical protein Pres01_23360 [Metapseudomonas resinovorans]|uniref:hypothetical protein n=1 Tax=Metapseudomonas resinovorans TaxID=53412 RepID=UPI000984B5C5|nr:hypothetical protein [Pseudomonas resinovorans]GLZ86285.1 hypothetical protein Pres01_23360 [Pseudomonas resinovorans]